MDPLHTIMYKHKFTTKARTGDDVEAYVFWLDWFDAQPGAEKVEDISEKR